MRPFELRPERSSKPDRQRQDDCGGKHCPWRRPDVRELARASRFLIDARVFQIDLVELTHSCRIALLRCIALSQQLDGIDSDHRLQNGSSGRPDQGKLASHLSAFRVGDPLDLTTDRRRSRCQ